MASQLTWALALSAWMLAGSCVALRLHQAGHPLSTVAAAVPCWPLLLPALARPPAATGPLAGRIEATFARLRAALVDEPDLPIDVDGLRRALHAADARLGRIDRLLAEEGGGGLEPELETLRAVRARTVYEIEAALAEAARIRIHAGLLAIASDAAPLRGQLGALTARVRAIEEVARAAMLEPPP